MTDPAARAHARQQAAAVRGDVCVCGCDVTDHGFWFGCIRCDCPTFAARPSPAGTDTTRDDEK